MDRRTFLKVTAGAGSLAATGGLATPAISQGAAAKTLRFVPQANLANFDPIWGTQYVVRNAAVLVWDTLYGVDEKLQPQRQMVESEETSTDGLTWTFKLRRGLKFHDGEPVLAKDVIASLTRWKARDPHGPDAQGDPAGARRRRRPHRSSGCSRSPTRRCCSRSARTRRRWRSSCRSASPRPIRSSRSRTMSARAR